MPQPTRARIAQPVPVSEHLSQLGSGLAAARKRRHLSRADMAERMMVNPKTVSRMEAGDPSVGIGIIATALWVLGLDRRLAELASPQTDTIGLQADLNRLPARIRKPSPTADDFDF